MMQRQLVVIAGPETGRTFRVEDGQTLTIGRGQTSDTQINDPHMSRVHCRVQVDGGKMLLADAGSSSGTLDRRSAHHGARVTAGRRVSGWRHPHPLSTR